MVKLREVGGGGWMGRWVIVLVVFLESGLYLVVVMHGDPNKSDCGRRNFCVNTENGDGYEEYKVIRTADGVPEWLRVAPSGGWWVVVVGGGGGGSFLLLPMSS
jgi:hypothetical protein